VQKLIKSHKKRKELNFLIIISALILTLLTISPAAASVSTLEFSSFTGIGHAPAQIYAKNLENVGGLGLTLTLYENFEPFKKIGQYLDILYMLGGMVAAILICLIYPRISTGENAFITNLRKTLYSLKIRKVAETGAEVQEDVEVKELWLYIAIPILCIGIAELLIFSGRMGAAVWVHIGILIALSLSNIFIKDPRALSLSNIFIKDPRVHNIYMPLMLLPVLRLVNLSMPIFFETTLYTFIFVYSPLMIPVAAIIIHQQNSLEEIGITKKHFLAYMALSVPLGFLMGLGEYLTIRTGFLIPDLTFVNLFKLTIVMVFFVGLVEELIFRSILQTSLERALSVPEALIITSLLFGLMHSGYGTFNEMLYTGFVGLIMGLLFYKTKSLPFVAVLHGFVNVFLFGILPHHLIGWTWF